MIIHNCYKHINVDIRLISKEIISFYILHSQMTRLMVSFIIILVFFIKIIKKFSISKFYKVF